MKAIFRIAAILLLAGQVAGQTSAPSIQERLGYPPNSKLLIIHADDLGVAHAENEASTRAMEEGSVRSGSVMVPCPWLPEMAAYARLHPEADLGIHCTLTSEWQGYKWGPVAGAERVPSLVNRYGYFYSSVDSLARFAQLTDIETEIRAQIEKALSLGIRPTHLDAHMGCLFLKPEYLKLLIRLGGEYRVPVLLNQAAFQLMFQVNIKPLIGPGEVVLDQVFMAQPSDFAAGMENYYRGVFESIKPGLSCILLHAAYDNDEMKAITAGHPDYGAAWRQADYAFFTSAACRRLLEQQGIRLITWKEVKDKLYKGKP